MKYGRLGPSAGERLLLRAAVADGADALSAWDEWRRAGGDIDALGPPAARLLPAVYRKLEAGGVEDADLGRLRGVYRHAWAMNQRVAASVAAALLSLGRAGIDTMLLKGAAVWAAHHRERDAGARRLDDAGVLVRPPDFRRALALLRADGWAPAGPSRQPVSLMDPDGFGITLHSRALPGPGGDEDFWAGAVPAELGGVSTLVPGPAEQLLSVGVHGVTADRGSLAWIADAAVIVQGAGDRLDWRRLVDGAARRELALTTRTSLELVRSALDVPIPDRVLAALAALPSTRRERLVLSGTAGLARSLAAARRRAAGR